MSSGAGARVGEMVNMALVADDAARARGGGGVSGHGHVGDVAPAGFWEERYAGEERVWSGKVNRTTADVAMGEQPGRSLDLGCGEGGGVLWFAHAGWQAMGVDISPNGRAPRQRGSGTRRPRRPCPVCCRRPDDVDDRRTLRPSSTASLPVFSHSTGRRSSSQLSRQIDGGHLLVVSHMATTSPGCRPKIDKGTDSS